MQKLLKTKTNYKKILSDKDILHKYDYKHSQTLSTNQSKIHHQIEKENLAYQPNLNMKILMQKNLNRYGTSKELFYLADFEETFGRSRTRQKILLKDVCNFKDEEVMEQSYSDQKSVQELTELFEYYKYYINNPIIFSKDHFKILYNFYEKKKYLQYKRLKAVLDLDDQKDSDQDGSMNENISMDAKKTTKQNTKTFYIMNLIETQFADKNSQSQSKAFLELNSHLQEMLGKMGQANTNTPKKENYAEVTEKTSTIFKKKKIIPFQVSSYKNTIGKKTKKQSFHNSNSSLKKIKMNKYSKQPYPSRFNVETFQLPSMKSKNEYHSKKVRRTSNLSMGELQGKSTNFNISSPKKYHKKRLNSCQTVISKNCSKEKPLNEKKQKKHLPTESKFKEEINEEVQLEQFKSYLKRISGNHRKNTEKAAQSGISSHSSKFKKQIQAQKPEPNLLIKKLKKKGPLKNTSTSAKNSLQKSPQRESKQHLVQQSIFNLKKKIRMAKQTIKSSNANSGSNLHQYKNKKAL